MAEVVSRPGLVRRDRGRRPGRRGRGKVGRDLSDGAGQARLGCSWSLDHGEFEDVVGRLPPGARGLPADGRGALREGLEGLAVVIIVAVFHRVRVPPRILREGHALPGRRAPSADRKTWETGRRHEGGHLLEGRGPAAQRCAITAVV